MSTADLILRAAALVIATGVLSRAGIAVYRTARRIEDTFDLVHHELQPNGGASLRDVANRLEHDLTNVRLLVNDGVARIARLEQASAPFAVSVVNNNPPTPEA